MFPVIKAYCHITWLHNAQVIFRKLAFKPAIGAEINGKSICFFPDLFAAVCVDAVLEKNDTGEYVIVGDSTTRLCVLAIFLKKDPRIFLRTLGRNGSLVLLTAGNKLNLCHKIPPIYNSSLMYDHSCAETIKQDAPWFCQKNDKDKFLYRHIDQTGKVA